MTSEWRVGIGHDLHRLEAGQPLRLGGVAIPFDRGLIGHSDADVVLHAVTDAVLGAAGLPDIGEQFPDTNPAFRGADSGRLLAEVMRLAHASGWTIGNLDVIVHAERPKLSAFKRPMAERIAALVGCDADRVSVKAKTSEGLGEIGRSEAMACTVVALLKRESSIHRAT